MHIGHRKTCSHSHEHMIKTLLSFIRVPFIRDVTTMQMGRIVMIGSSFLASILYARFLGLGGYGEYAVILAFTGTAGIITNLGQQATALTFFAESYGKKDRMSQGNILQYFMITSLLSIVFLGILALFAPLLTEWFHGKREIGILARMIFVSSMFEFGFIWYSITLQVTRHIRFLTILENTKTLLQLILATVFLFFGLHVFGVLLSSLIVSILFCFVSFFLYSRLQKTHDVPGFREAVQHRHMRHLWKYAKDGIWIAIDKNLGSLYPTVFIFAVSTQTSEAITGLVRLGFKLASLPASMAIASISRLASSVIPTIIGQVNMDVFTKIRMLFFNTFKIHIFVSVAAAICITIFLPYVYGEHFRPAIYPFLIIVFLNLSLGLHAIATPILRVLSKIHIAAYLSVIGITVGLGILFGLGGTLPITQALYLSLLAYHMIIALVLIPVMDILKKVKLPPRSS